MDVTPLRNVGGFSKVYCAMICSAETECHAVKPISTSGNGVTCELYAEPEAGNIVSISGIYVKNKWKLFLEGDEMKCWFILFILIKMLTFSKIILF